MRQQSFIKGLFFGDVADDLIFPWPEPSEADVGKIHADLEGVRRFFELHVDSAQIDRERRIPPSVLDGLKQLGAFGWHVPQTYGGGGLTHAGYARVIQEVAGLDPSIALTLGAHQDFGARGLALFGSEEQKARYLPRLATGQWVAAFALTESSGGSDAAAIKTRAERSADGGYVLNGTKAWVTNGGIADLFTVFARTSPADEGAKPKITAFLVERGAGVSSGAEEDKLGVRGSSTTSVQLNGVRVPDANVLGEVGRGFKLAVEVLSGGRIGLASSGIGLCKRAIRMAVERCRLRRAFGRPIGEFGLIKDKMASMMSDTWALESVTYLTAGLADSAASDFSIEAAIAKVLGCETTWRVIGDAMQIAAGSGYMADAPYERWLRDARVHFVFGGTNEIMRAFIALSGMQGPGRRLADVARAMREPIKGFGLLSDLALRRAKSAFGRGKLTRHHPSLNREGALLEHYVQELSSGVEKVLRKHRRNVAEMQYTQKRTADMVIDLYALAACIARTTRVIERRGEEGGRREIDLTRIFASGAEARLARTLAAIDKNDDELRKSVATRAYADGAWPFDVF